MSDKMIEFAAWIGLGMAAIFTGVLLFIYACIPFGVLYLIWLLIEKIT